MQILQKKGCCEVWVMPATMCKTIQVNDLSIIHKKNRLRIVSIIIKVLGCC